MGPLYLPLIQPQTLNDDVYYVLQDLVQSCGEEDSGGSACAMGYDKLGPSWTSQLSLNTTQQGTGGRVSRMDKQIDRS